MQWQQLSEESCSQVFKPSVVGPHITSGQDELLIHDTELQRIHAMGKKNVLTLIIRPFHNTSFKQLLFMLATNIHPSLYDASHLNCI